MQNERKNKFSYCQNSNTAKDPFFVVPLMRDDDPLEKDIFASIESGRSLFAKEMQFFVFHQLSAVLGIILYQYFFKCQMNVQASHLKS